MITLSGADHDKQRLMPWLLAAMLVLLLALAGSAIWILDQFQREARENSLAQLRLNVDTLRHEISAVWLPQHLNNLRVWSADFVTMTPREVQRHLSQLRDSGAYQDFWLLDASSGRVRVAAHPEAVGQPSPFVAAPRYAAKLAALAVGREQALLLGPDPAMQARIRVLLMLPLGKPGQPPSAYLQVLVRDPASLLDSPIRYRLGETGETYLVDADGFLLSESRFIKRGDGENKVRLRAQVPGANSLRGSAPLTLAANVAIRSRGKWRQRQGVFGLSWRAGLRRLVLERCPGDRGDFRNGCHRSSGGQFRTPATDCVNRVGHRSAIGCGVAVVASTLAAQPGRIA
jgi:hypothetical protein